MSQDIENLLKSHFSIKEQKADHHFRTEIPNIVFDLDLDPYEFKIYAYIKKIGGDQGGCWKSKPNIAKECSISKRKVDDAVQKLSSPFDLLGGKSLITFIPRENNTSLLIINDIWRENGDKFRSESKKEGGGAPNAGGGCTPCTGGGARHAHKEDLFKQDPIKLIDIESADPTRIKIIDFDGKERMHTKEDIFTLCVQGKYDWSAKEIDLVFLKLATHMRPVRELSKFCDKIIKNERNNQYNEKISKSNQKSEPIKQESKVIDQGRLRKWSEFYPEKKEKK